MWLLGFLVAKATKLLKTKGIFSACFSHGDCLISSCDSLPYTILLSLYWWLLFTSQFIHGMVHHSEAEGLFFCVFQLLEERICLISLAEPMNEFPLGRVSIPGHLQELEIVNLIIED